MEEKKTFKKKKEVKLSLEDKRDVILKSKMPDWQKEEYLERMFSKKEEKKGVPYAVYAVIRKIPERLHNAMLVFPNAKGVELASLQEWDKIFKNF